MAIPKTMTSVQQPSTKDDILQFLLKEGQATAQTLAEHLGVSPQAIRRHLKDLETDALIEHQAVQEGMGRPNYFYMLSRKGRDRFPTQYDQFAVSLLDTLTETVGEEQVSVILEQQWQRKSQAYRAQIGAGPLLERVQKLVKLRQAEGFMAEWHPVEVKAAADAHRSQETGAAYVITEYNCAISHIAESYPTVCGHELAMFAYALPDCSVERTHWLVQGEHRCGYLIQEK
jgi:DeoR family suf operon transcriptional repressor